MKKVFIGKRALDGLGQIFSSHEGASVCLFRGENSFSNSGAQERINSTAKQFHFESEYICSPNPDFENILDIIKRFRKNQADFIIAVGGGSVLDTAKIVNCLNANAEDELSFASIVKGTLPITKKGRPMIAVPTTTGSGSEATHFATIYEHKKKYSIAAPSILPDFIILDPGLCYNTPAKIMAISGIDALSHAVESLWARGSDEQSRKYAKKAVKLIFKNIELSVRDRDKKAIENLQLGAFYAGRAINISKTTAAHALSYPLTSFLNIPHGHSVGLVLYRILKLHIDACHKSSNGTLNKAMEFLTQAFSSSDLPETWNSLLKKMGLETDLSRLGFEKNRHLALIIENCSLERLGNNPVPINEADIREIFNK